MVYDYEKMAKEYALSYKDKSRIYFIEKYLSTFDATVGKKKQFKLFPRQKVFLNTLAKNKNIISIKPRQCGITTLTSGWACAQCVFADENSPETILCIGNKLDLAQQLITKIRDFLLQVPRWYWGNDFFSEDPKSEKNKRDIFVKNSKSELELFNGCRIVARSSGENAARGISAASILIFDEAAFIENGKAVYASAVATTSSNPNAKIVMVSTPNGHDELYYDTYRQALAKKNNFIAVQFRWYQDPRYNKGLKWYKKDEKTNELMWDNDPIVDKSDESVAYDEKRWDNLVKKGWTPISNWYTSMCQSFNNDTMKIAQELDVSFQGSADNVVAPEYIEMQEKMNVREPLEDFIDPMTKETWFWKRPIDGHRYILACLPKGEKVRTQRGLVNVEDVQETDKLLTKDGKLVSIVHKMRRNVTDEKIVTFRPSNTCRKTTFTWNHPILSSINTPLKRKHGEKRYWDFNFKKNNAEDVNIKDWLVVPNTYYLKELTEEEIMKKWAEYENATRVDFRIKCPLLDEDFWWYCGIWLAEGWVSKNRHQMMSIQTAHCIKETYILDKITVLTERLFNRKATFCVLEKNNSIKSIISSKSLALFMNNNFGKCAKNKYIAEWIKYLPRKYKIKLIEGYNQGDGFIHREHKNSGFTSISLKLLEDVQDILFSLGIIGSIKLHVKEGTVHMFPHQRQYICSNKYELSLGLYDTKKLLEIFGIQNNIELKNRRIIKDCFFSEDLTKIYFRVAEKEEKLYSGFVYNFWVDDETHTYACMNITCGNCDPSRGTAHDKTAIVIIDMDGRDEDGIPIIEEVAEYNGKKLGDDIGNVVYNYATLYNNAYVIFDATGGQADAAILTMINLGYKNFYYEDNVQKTYMVQHSSKQYNGDLTDTLPGFHFQGNRYPVLSNFANMVRNNEIKIRSSRIINELNTWIFKENTGKMDHQAGSWDDLICAMAMALFVMQFSLNKIRAAQNKDKAILNAYMMAGSANMLNKSKSDGKLMRPSSGLPFYSEKTLKKYSNAVNGSYLWLFSGYYS